MPADPSVRLTGGGRIGTLVGLEIPLLVRILRAQFSLKAALGNVLSLDYLGALAGSLLFPFVALPFLGLSRASIVSRSSSISSYR